MSDQSIRRRDFLKMMGIGAATIGASVSAPNVIAKTSSGTLVESKSDYGNFMVEVLKKGNYKFDLNMLKPMSEKNNAFSRNMWDPARLNRPREDLDYERLVEGKGKIINQTRLDYALNAGAWRFAMMDSGGYDWGTDYKYRYGGGPWDPADIDMTWEDASRATKHAALFYGASLAGIAELNPLWLYSEHYAPTRENRKRSIPVIRDGERYEKTEEAWYIPKSMNHVIAVLFEEDYYAIANSPGRIATAASGTGYSRMAFTAGCLAEFIRFLGYRALPAGNGIGLSIPIAIDAGLGELGRMGILVTPKYGPRVRIAKVITDMPLVADSPIRFGVTEFCEVCKLCTEYCPSDSISDGPRTWKGKSISNNPGIYKWYIAPDSCYDYNGFSCSNCKRICPFTKPNNSWLHRMIRTIIKGRIGALDKVMVTFDQASGYGKEISDTEFWNMDGHKCITARESM